jgi:hypothetical protein
MNTNENIIDFSGADEEPTTVGGRLAELVWDGWIDRAIFDDYRFFPLDEIKALSADQWNLWATLIRVEQPTAADIAEAISILAHKRARSEWI